MRLAEIAQHQQRIDNLFKLPPPSSLEVAAHWSQYLCILISGFLETSVQTVYGEYARVRAHPNIVKYVEKQLRGFQNPNMQKITDLARSFSDTWAAELEQETKIRDSVNSIIANRHQIAHGKSSDITLIRLRPWYQDAIRLVELIKLQCGI
jgi:hypothetical protein